MGKVLDKAKQIEKSGLAPSRAAANGTTAIPGVAELAAMRREWTALAEEILRAVAPKIGNRSTWAPRLFFTADELAVFDSLGWDKRRLEAELGRISALVTWEREAGTGLDRIAAAERLAAAQAEVAAKAPDLESRIAALQSELATLQAAVRTSQAEVDRRARAVARLEELAPVEQREEHERLSLGLAPQRSSLVEARVRLATIRQAVALDVAGDPKARRAARLIASTMKPSIVAHSTQEGVDPAGWRAFVKELEAEIPGLEQRIETEKAALDAKVAEAGEPLLAHVL